MKDRTLTGDQITRVASPLGYVEIFFQDGTCVSLNHQSIEQAQKIHEACEKLLKLNLLKPFEPGREIRLRALELLQRIRQWDMLPGSADGPYWIAEIDEVLEAARKAEAS